MNRQAQEQAIAKDLELCDMIIAFGSKANKAKALKHRKACFAHIKAWNAENGLDGLSDDELLKELLA